MFNVEAETTLALNILKGNFSVIPDAAVARCKAAGKTVTHLQHSSSLEQGVRELVASPVFFDKALTNVVNAALGLGTSVNSGVQTNLKGSVYCEMRDSAQQLIDQSSNFKDMREKHEKLVNGIKHEKEVIAQKMKEQQVELVALQDHHRMLRELEEKKQEMMRERDSLTAALPILRTLSHGDILKLVASALGKDAASQNFEERMKEMAKKV